MVDKAILMQSDLFLAGAQGQCGKRCVAYRGGQAHVELMSRRCNRSSWTASVATARRVTLLGEGEFAGRKLLNEVDYWEI